MVLEAAAGVVREKNCWLVGGWRLLLEWCERKILVVAGGCCWSGVKGKHC